MFTVVSGSMEPDYNVGDVLISKKVLGSEIKIGDDVSYLGKSGSFTGKVVTHRVTNIENDVDGNLVFHTKGLANLVEDPIVYESQLYGVVVHKAKVLSFVYKCISNKQGMFVFIVIPILYVVGSEMIYFMLAKEEKRRNNLKVNIETKKSTEEEIKKEEKTSKRKAKKIVKK